jgi:CMP-N,N'-diacetyllegionaminic acid synthase
MRLCVIPARGGSKGVKDKNLRVISGHSLTGWAVGAAKSSRLFDQVVVSTDSKKIGEEARKYGADVVERPEELSGDLIGDLPVLKQALEECESRSRCTFSTVVMLQPTSPLRQACDIAKSVSLLEEEGEERYDWVMTVSPVNIKFHPLKVFVQTAPGSSTIELIDPHRSSEIVARQQLSPCFMRNGLAYAFDSLFLRKSGPTHKYGNEHIGMVVVNRPIANIDSLEDLEAAEQLMIGSGGRTGEKV